MDRVLSQTLTFKSLTVTLTLTRPFSMARIVTQTVTLKPQTLTLTRSLSPSLLAPCRCKSNSADNGSFIAIDIRSGAKRIEDALHSIYAQRSAPDWLPFVPGSSYWVPPKNEKTSVAVADFVRLIKTTLLEPLTEDEVMSFKTVRGWPSSAYFVEGNPVKRKSKKGAAQSDDEE